MSIEPPAKDRQAKRRVAGLLLLAAVLAVVMTSVRPKPGMTVVYRTAAERYLRGESFYVPGENMAFSYPPFFVLAYVPLALLPEAAARAVWYGMNFGLLGAIAGMTVRMLRPAMEAGLGRRGPRPRVALLLIGVFSARFLISPIEYQSHDLIVYFLMMVAIWRWDAGEKSGSGVAAGAAAACKATPLLFLPVFLWQRRLRTAVVMTAIVVSATLLPDLFVRNPDGKLWVASWHEKFLSRVDAASAPEAEGAWNRWNMLNQSLSGTLYRLCTPIEKEDEWECCWNVCLVPVEGRALDRLAIGLKLAILAALAWITWPTRLGQMGPGEQTFCRLGQGGALLAAMLLLSPMTSKQHFCVLLAPLSFCLVDALYRRRDPLVWSALALVFLFGAVAGKDVLGSALHRQLAAYGSLTWCTLVCFGTCGYVVARRARAARQARQAPGARPQENDEAATSGRGFLFVRAGRLVRDRPTCCWASG
jgi:alpha-1,2-mannosyltransferase